MSGKVFEQPLRIRWNHCDPAGIVYHPQYFVMLNNAMEDFFRECAGLSYEESLVEGYGFPIAGIGATSALRADAGMTACCACGSRASARRPCASP